MSAIPTRSRQLVRERDGDTCQRCGSGNNLAWHHRRRRAVKGGHNPHCACIGVQLCGTCHTWVHANPGKAQETGMIVSPYEDEPWLVPLKTFAGWCVNACDGDSAWMDPPGISDNTPAMADN